MLTGDISVASYEILTRHFPGWTQENNRNAWCCGLIIWSVHTLCVSDNLLTNLPIFMTRGGNVIQLDYISAQYKSASFRSFRHCGRWTFWLTPLMKQSPWESGFERSWDHLTLACDILGFSPWRNSDISENHSGSVFKAEAYRLRNWHGYMGKQSACISSQFLTLHT
jgi:hypothetical protein